MPSDYCRICGAGRRTTDGSCRFDVPEAKAPWIREFSEKGLDAREDPDLRLQVARWLLHHPDRTNERDLVRAARIAGMSTASPDPDDGPREDADGSVGPEDARPESMNPSDRVPVVRRSEETQRRELAELRWGLIPPGVPDPAEHPQPVHARAESVDRKPLLRGAFLERRCIMPADGFPVWDGETRRLVRSRDEDRPLAFAALWERWEPTSRRPDRDPVESCVLITVPANELVGRYQDRMPAILDPKDVEAWLDPATPVAEAKALLRPSPADELRVVPGGG